MAGEPCHHPALAADWFDNEPLVRFAGIEAGGGAGYRIAVGIGQTRAAKGPDPLRLLQPGIAILVGITGQGEAVVADLHAGAHDWRHEVEATVRIDVEHHRMPGPGGTE